MDKDAFRAADGEMVIRADMTLGGAKISVSLRFSAGSRLNFGGLSVIMYLALSIYSFV